MREPAIEDIWATAGGFDPVLRARPDQLTVLRRKRIRPQPAQREALFAAAAQNRPVVLTGVQVPVAGSAQLGLEAALFQALTHTFKRGDPVSVQIGRHRNRRKLPVPELMRRWQSGRHIVSITDLHIRGTVLEHDINTDELSAFNLFPLGSEDMQRQEMMTLVVSSAGNVTDSHSDDPDGSNHCFTGRKLWLAWDTFEGQRAGLQDCSRDEVIDGARFNLRAFCGLKSAKWWTVGPGETLFLPGSLSHRVVTLESYMGIGSFYCTPASCLENLSRWYAHGALWSMDDPEGDNANLVDEVATRMCHTVQRLARRKADVQQQWGLDYAGVALKKWQTRWSAAQRRRLMEENPAFGSLVRVLEGVAQPVS